MLASGIGIEGELRRASAEPTLPRIKWPDVKQRNQASPHFHNRSPSLKRIQICEIKLALAFHKDYF